LPGVESLAVTGSIHGSEIAKVIAQQSISFVPELLKQFGIREDVLPGICVLSKTQDKPWLIRLSDRWDTSEIKRWLSRLSMVPEGESYNPEAIIKSIEVFREHIEQISRYTERIETYRESILQRLESLAWRYQGTEEDREKMAIFYENQRFAREDVERFLQNLSFYNKIDNDDVRVRSIFNTGGNITDMESKLLAATETIKGSKSVRQILERRQKFSEQVESEMNVIVASSQRHVFFENAAHRIPSGKSVSDTIVRIGRVSHRIYNSVGWIKEFF
jgi:hypothetical protein